MKKRLLYYKPVQNAPILAATYQALGTVHTIHLAEVGGEGDAKTSQMVPFTH